MSAIRLLLDEDVRSTLAEALRARGHDAVAVAELGMEGTKDPDLIEWARRRIQEGQALSWRHWRDLCETKPSTKCEAEFAKVREAASEYLAHPRIREDLAQAIRLVHRLAAEALQYFQERKESLGLIDYNDMERKTLLLLDRPDVQARLGSEIELLLVDEFQDTNPVQLAIFLKLSELFRRTIWVGDPKQCILSVQEADAALMNAVLKQLAAGGTTVLAENRRSRPEIVDFCSSLYSQAFERDGIPPEHVRVRSKVAFRSALPPLSVWRLEGKNQGLRWNAIASRIRSMIEAKEKVIDRLTGAAREIRPGDFAVLAPIGDWCVGVANALRQQGIESSCPSGRLSKQPEVVLAIAALRFAVDPSDTAAAAEIVLLLGKNSDQWLEEALREKPDPLTWSPMIDTLSKLSHHVHESTPAELLDQVIQVTELDSRAERWPNGLDRLNNLAALRALVRKYEAHCAQGLAPCTSSGFLSYLADVQRDVRNQGQEEDKVPGWSRPDAVDVMTYHKAKGLEWPVVILTGLESSEWQASLFGVRVVGPAGKDFDASQPLKGRSIRYLPYPFGGMALPSGLAARLSPLPEMAVLQEAISSETRRLLYVGMTRPRENLVFAIQSSGETDPGARAGALTDPAGQALLRLPQPGDTQIQAGKESFACETLILKPVENPAPQTKEKQLVLPPPGPRPRSRPLLYASPSSLGPVKDLEHLVSLGRKIDLGGKIALTAKIHENELGDAVHGFFASDDPELPRPEREAMAGELLSRWSVSHALKAPDLVAASDRLFATLAREFQGMELRREEPVLARISGRDDGSTILRGSIDLLALGKSAGAVIDHKTTNITEATALARAREHAPQLVAYGQSVRVARGLEEVSLWLHFPLGGFMVEVIVKEPGRLLERSYHVLEGEHVV